MLGDSGFVGSIRVPFNRRLETADTFSESFAQLGKLLRSEHEQSNSKDYQEMRRLQQSFQHESPFTSELQNIVTEHQAKMQALLPCSENSAFLRSACHRRAIAARSQTFLREWFGSRFYQASNANKPFREEAAGSTG